MQEEGCKSVILVNLQVGISRLHYSLTSSKIIFRDFKYMNAFEQYFLLYKILEKHLWNSFLLYVEVEIQQLVNEITSFPEVLYKKGDLKNFSKLTDKHKKESSRGVLSKDILKHFAKLTDKHLCLSLFFNKVAGWTPETVRSSYWRCSVKKGVVKKVHRSEATVHRSSTK